MHVKDVRLLLTTSLFLAIAAAAAQESLPVIEVEGQPLGANIKRLIAALEYLGHPLSEALTRELTTAAEKRDGPRLQALLDRQVLLADIPADGQLHPIKLTVPIGRSSWVALREFPQLNTNPVNVIVDDSPIRVSKQSAQSCIDATELLWKNRKLLISEAERPAAHAAYQRAIARYQRIASECE